MAQALQRHTPERSAGILREEELSMKVMQITYVGQSFGSLFTFGQLSCFFLHTCLVHGTSPRCMCCKVSVEKKRMSQEFRQRKVYYKNERKQLDLERKWCSLFTANPSYTLSMGTCSQREGATIDLQPTTGVLWSLSQRVLMVGWSRSLEKLAPAGKNRISP